MASRVAAAFGGGKLGSRTEATPARCIPVAASSGAGDCGQEGSRQRRGAMVIVSRSRCIARRVWIVARGPMLT
jgi:hypothetical protein